MEVKQTRTGGEQPNSEYKTTSTEEETCENPRRNTSNILLTPQEQLDYGRRRPEFKVRA